MLKLSESITGREPSEGITQEEYEDLIADGFNEKDFFWNG
jgi:hypothetical protein